MNVASTIENAERILPGETAPDGQTDFRWQAIIKIGEFVESEPEAVWYFVKRWGHSDDEDIRNAIATCILEHLLEHHFSLIFPLIEKEAKSSNNFTDTLHRCWYFGEADTNENNKRLKKLLNELK